MSSTSLKSPFTVYSTHTYNTLVKIANRIMTGSQSSYDVTQWCSYLHVLNSDWRWADKKMSPFHRWTTIQVTIRKTHFWVEENLQTILYTILNVTVSVQSPVLLGQTESYVATSIETLQDFTFSLLTHSFYHQSTWLCVCVRQICGLINIERES